MGRSELCIFFRCSKPHELICVDFPLVWQRARVSINRAPFAGESVPRLEAAVGLKQQAADVVSFGVSRLCEARAAGSQEEL